jgi:hypothetical protein
LPILQTLSPAAFPLGSFFRGRLNLRRRVWLHEKSLRLVQQTERDVEFALARVVGRATEQAVELCPECPPGRFAAAFGGDFFPACRELLGLGLLPQNGGGDCDAERGDQRFTR